MRHLVLVPGVGRRADLRKLTHKISWQEGEEASQRLGWNGVQERPTGRRVLPQRTPSCALNLRFVLSRSVAHRVGRVRWRSLGQEKA